MTSFLIEHTMVTRCIDREREIWVVRIYRSNSYFLRIELRSWLAAQDTCPTWLMGLYKIDMIDSANIQKLISQVKYFQTPNIYSKSYFRNTSSSIH